MVEAASMLGVESDGSSYCKSSFRRLLNLPMADFHFDGCRLIIAFVAYFVLGAYYNYSTYGASGVDLIPCVFTCTY